MTDRESRKDFRMIKNEELEKFVGWRLFLSILRVSFCYQESANQLRFSVNWFKNKRRMEMDGVFYY